MNFKKKILLGFLAVVLVWFVIRLVHFLGWESSGLVAFAFIITLIQLVDYVRTLGEQVEKEVAY